MFVEVAFPLPVRQEFTYSVPSPLQREIKPGVQVLAPLGKKQLPGIVTKIVPRPRIETKPIIQINPLGPLLSPAILELTKWTANYYFCSWGEAIRAALPAKAQIKPQLWVELLSPEKQERERLSNFEAELLDYLESKKKKVSFSTLTKEFRGRQILETLRQLEKKGVVELSHLAQKAKSKIKAEQVVEAGNNPETEGLTSKERELFNFLMQKGRLTVREIKREFPKSGKILPKLQESGLIKIYATELWGDFWQSYQMPEQKELELSAEQREVLGQIDASIQKKMFAPFLLQGVTGSGKTEVYLQAGRQVLAQGRKALILVPEISLAIQTILSFKAVFGDKVIQLHSGLTETERLDVWGKIRAGKYPVVVGVRSAIFAPLENLGLIVVDEEYDSSYKQSDLVPRYNARDLALVRGKLEKAVVILGSATPSLESYRNALSGKYTLLTLSERVQKKPLPQVEIVDLKGERKNGNYGFLSEKLKGCITEEIQKKQQVILFLNRRGFSTLIKCQECGLVPICRNCNVTLTYHRQGHWLKCHFCGYQKKAPSACPACHSLKFLYKGAGTQRIEEEIKILAGEESVRRLDSDLSAKRNYTRNLLVDFQTGKFPILLGTQMVTKGYDFPEVTLVGVISADISLELPDFRSGEKTFQLLTQVAGRSGRGQKPGQVIIQTYHPLECPIQLASLQDYPGFYQHEISTRRELGYPPFCHVILLLISGVSLPGVQRLSEELKQTLAGARPDKVFEILGPAPAPIEKVRRKYRYRIMLKTQKVFETLRILEKTLPQNKFDSKQQVRVAVDVDPADLL